MRQFLEFAVVRLLLATLSWLPLPLARPLSRFYAGILDTAVPRLRETARQNLRFALPEAHAEKIVDGLYASIARLLLSFARFPFLHRGNISEWIRYEGFEHYEEAKARGKGVLFATAHLGNWELSAFAHSLLTEPMNVVVRPLDNSLLDNFVEAQRSLSGNRIVKKKEAARSILRALSKNEPVGVLIDQNASRDEGVFVDFFGVPASAGTAFARIANHSGAAVLPGFAVWSEAEQIYILRFLPLVPMTGDVWADTAATQAVLERAIRGYPDQWLWIHRRWKTRPEGEPPMYLSKRK